MRRPDEGPAARFDPLFVVAGLLLAGLLWAYWPTTREMVHRWSVDPRYAHGYLVPVFAAALLWIRRDRLATLAPRPAWGGLLLIGAGLGLKSVGAYYYFGWVEAASILPTLAGLCVLVWGWKSLRWSWPAIAFLLFMLPLPYRLEGAMAHPLQRVATRASTYAMQTLGFPALAEGNVIHLNEVEIGVVEACSGLSMLFTFFAMTTGIVLVIRRPWPDKVLIVASAVPIALLVNVTRITVTGILHETVGSRLANLVFHDLAGLLMMPLGLLLIWIEIGLLDRLLTAPAAAAGSPRPAGPVSPAQVPADGRESGEGRCRDRNKDSTASAPKRVLKTP